LFTDFPIDDYLSNIFEAACKPLLIYIQELYGSPFRLNGLQTRELTPTTPSAEIIFKAENFTYGKLQRYDYQSGRVFQIMRTINSNFNRSLKSSYTATLNVDIPKDTEHPFWNIDRPQRHGDMKMFKYVPSGDSVSFRVQRWGPCAQHAKYYATQRAKDIIWNIRLRVSGTRVFGRPAILLRSHIPASCPAYSLGVLLQNIWKAETPRISTSSFAVLAVDLIQKLKDKNTLASLDLLLTYYQVNVRLVD
jgi:hypothetical protein